MAAAELTTIGLMLLCIIIATMNVWAKRPPVMYDSASHRWRAARRLNKHR